MSFEEFQDGCLGDQHEYRNTILENLNPTVVAQCLPPSLGSIQHMVRKEIMVLEFQDGHSDHLEILGYWNRQF